MEASSTVKFFEKNIGNGENIFHEIARDKMLWMLYRIQNTVNEEMDFLLRESNDQGETCIHIAAYGRREKSTIEMIKIFVSLGADINARNNTGDTPLHYAVYNDDCELVKWLCVQENIDLNAMNQKQLTPYELAIMRNSKNIANVLSEYQTANYDAESRRDEADGRLDDFHLDPMNLQVNEERPHMIN